jgi:dCMP deaminase
MAWDKYFLGMAEYVSGNSKCWSRKVGAVLVRDKRVLGVGYNGPPSGMEECWKSLAETPDTCPRKAMGHGMGEGLEMCVAAHAEANAIATAARMGTAIQGAIMYVWGAPMPCKTCAGLIVNSGIVEVVCQEGSYDQLAGAIFDRGQVKVRRYQEV